MLKELFYSEKDEELDYFRRASCQFAAFTARSPTKQTANEDCAGWIRLGHDSWVFLVADGLGGLPAGDAASRLAISKILDELEKIESPGDVRSAIISGIDNANQAILTSGTRGATTLVVVEFDQGTIRPYHIGDATILVTGQRGLVKFQTVSHSPTGYLEEAGLLNEKHAMLHEERHKYYPDTEWIVSKLRSETDMIYLCPPCFKCLARLTKLYEQGSTPGRIFVGLNWYASGVCLAAPLTVSSSSPLTPNISDKAPLELLLFMGR